VFLNLENTVWDEKILALIFGAAVELITFHPRNTVLDAQLMVYCESDRIEITSQITKGSQPDQAIVWRSSSIWVGSSILWGMSATPETSPAILRREPNFITEIIDADLREGRVQRVGTRFPPEPNGFPHIGHAFACMLNFDLARQYNGRFVLRMDDTNPEAERQEYVDAMLRDLTWLGVDWNGNLSYASDYFQQLHDCAVELIQQGLAYVDSVSSEDMARLRGTATTPGTPSPYRDRSITENLELFARMKNGEFERGTHVLRAKIDLGSPNMKLRDPVLYRIVHASHYRQGDAWCIYPSYDFAQAITDALDGVTHSLCSLEFVDNNAIYRWLMEHLWTTPPEPRQFEFGRRSLEYTVVSKRKLRQLVDEGHVADWDDPRMPTISAFRRRGVTPQAIQGFARQISVSRTNRTVDMALLEHSIRDDLNTRAPRVMAVLKPLRVVVDGLEDTVLKLPYWPPDVIEQSLDGLVTMPDGSRVRPEHATRAVPVTSELLIERDDFMPEAVPGFKRLVHGGKVRLRGAGVIRCDAFETDDTGTVSLLRCTLLPDTEKAAGVIHWVSASQSVPFEARLYDRLFNVPMPEAEATIEEENETESQEERDFLSFLNPNSLEINQGFVEPSVLNDPVDTRYQFERLGYFWRDPEDSSKEKIVMNRIITLRDSWAKEAESGKGKIDSRPRLEKPVQDRPLEISAEERARLESFTQRGVSEAEALVLAREPRLARYLENAARHGDVATLSSWVVNDLGPRLREGDVRLEPVQLARLVKLVSTGQLSRNQAKTVLTRAIETGENPSQIVEREGLRQVSDAGTLEPVVNAVIAANPDRVAAFRSGKTGLMGFFVGQVMKQTNNEANPQLVQEIVRRVLES
jgi:glutaminyl-tRNA synthetase